MLWWFLIWWWTGWLLHVSSRVSARMLAVVCHTHYSITSAPYAAGWKNLWYYLSRARTVMQHVSRHDRTASQMHDATWFLHIFTPDTSIMTSRRYHYHRLLLDASSRLSELSRLFTVTPVQCLPADKKSILFSTGLMSCHYMSVICFIQLLLTAVFKITIVLAISERTCLFEDRNNNM